MPDKYPPPHFWGCHVEDASAPAGPPPAAPAPEDCWHCGTTTTMNECPCTDCRDTADVVGGTYHCATCGRWWGYITVHTIELEVEELPGG